MILAVGEWALGCIVSAGVIGMTSSELSPSHGESAHLSREHCALRWTSGSQ